MLSSWAMPLPLSFANLFSYVFPKSVQRYYDDYLEHFFSHISRTLVSLKSYLPSSMVFLVLVAIDILVSVGFVACVFDLEVLATMVTLAAVVRAAIRQAKA